MTPDTRAPASPLLAGDSRHGTTRGHAAGCRCRPCRDARNTDEARRRKHRQVFGIKRAVPAVGTQRRIRALMALGWTARDIADRAGWATPQAVTVLLETRTYVYSKTAATIAKVYDELSMRIGPSEHNRRQSRRKGWAPPLAWSEDAIDDPDAEPHGMGESTATRRELLHDLDRDHAGITQVCRHLAVTRDALEKWAARNDMTPLYSRLVDREQSRYWRNGVAEGGAA